MGPGFKSQPDHKTERLRNPWSLFFVFNFLLLKIIVYCYILYSDKISKFYVGACIDLTRRLREHNAGHSKFSKTGIPWTLVYSEQFPDLPSAKKENLLLKIKTLKHSSCP